MEFINDLRNLIRNIRVLNIPRIEDLPYNTSPPIQFVYQSTATLNVGTYTWADNPSALTSTRPILGNALYYFRDITFTADIEELDFTSNMTVIPEFRAYRKAAASAMLYREPIQMVKYLENFPYRLTWLSQQTRTANAGGATGSQDQILGGFVGTIAQGPGLIGVADITLTAIIAAQEIVEEDYIDLFRRKYPKS